MGITGLLLALKEIQQKKHLREYKNQKIAIDAFCWLHKGAYSCALELGQNIPTTRYIDFCVKRLKMVIENGAIPLVVFDGGRLPMKKDTEAARGKSRQFHREEASELWKQGKKDAAIKKYGESVSITGEMAFEFIKILRKMKIEYVVAPYEADAQLAYLFKEKYVDLILTEDSDLLAFGAEKVLFKLDNEGYGFEIDMKCLNQVKEMDFTNFSKDAFLKMCILNGCDYLPSIKGIGLKKAYQFVKQSTDIKQIIKNMEKVNKYTIPDSYEKDFERAFLTFKFQTVYDLKKKCLTNINKIENTTYVEIFSYNDLSFLGPYFFIN